MWRALAWLLLAPSLGCGVAFVGDSGTGGAASDATGTTGGDGAAATTASGSSAGPGGAPSGAGPTSSSSGAGGAGGAGGAPPRSWTVVETLTVPVDGTTAISATVLQLGGTYRLRASGTFIISTTQGTEGDAEYFDFSNPPASVSDGGASVDHGLAIDDSVVDLDRNPKWGAFSPSHVYEVDYPATGNPIVAQFHDEVPSNNTGSLTLDILELD